MNGCRKFTNRAAARRLHNLSRYGSRKVKSRIRHEKRRQRYWIEECDQTWCDDAYVLDLVLERIPF